MAEPGSGATPEVIDAHHHLWRYDPAGYGWITPEMEVLRRDFLVEDLDRVVAAAGVSGSVAVQARQTLEETMWLLELAEEPGARTIRGVVGWVPLASEELAGVLRQLEGRRKLKGVRHVVQDEPDGFLTRPEFNRGISMLLGTGLVYDVLVFERQVAQAVEFVARHPRQVFVLDHCAKPRIAEGLIEPWREGMVRLAEQENVFCKLSGLATEAAPGRSGLGDLAPYLDAALEVFGAERLMAGSDWPVSLLACGYAEWWKILIEWTAGLNAGDRAAVLGGTAKKVYRLDE